jgi:hypothetical protein
MLRRASRNLDGEKLVGLVLFLASLAFVMLQTMLI